VAGVFQHDPPRRREGPFQGVDRPADVEGAVDQQDRDGQGRAGAEQPAGSAAVGVEGAAALPVRPQVGGELALGVLAGPGWVGEVGRQVASGSTPIPDT
jgi:hypothetical protein